MSSSSIHTIYSPKNLIDVKLDVWKMISNNKSNSYKELFFAHDTMKLLMFCTLITYILQTLQEKFIKSIIYCDLLNDKLALNILLLYVAFVIIPVFKRSNPQHTKWLKFKDWHLVAFYELCHILLVWLKQVSRFSVCIFLNKPKHLSRTSLRC